MSPWRAEPLVYLAWQYARRMQARPRCPANLPTALCWRTQPLAGATWTRICEACGRTSRQGMSDLCGVTWPRTGMVTARSRACMQVCLDDTNSKGNARDPGCVMRNRIAAYLYSKQATEKPIPLVGPPAELAPLSSLISGLLGEISFFVTRRGNACWSGLLQDLSGLHFAGAVPCRAIICKDGTAHMSPCMNRLAQR